MSLTVLDPGSETTTVVLVGEQDDTQAQVEVFTPPTLLVIDPSVGPRGDPGPQGEPAPLTWQTFVYHQDTVLDVWPIVHTLPYPPNVSVVDSSGRVVEGDVVYVSDTEISVTFSAPFAGVAYLS